MTRAGLSKGGGSTKHQDSEKDFCVPRKAEARGGGERKQSKGGFSHEEGEKRNHGRTHLKPREPGQY